MEPGQHDTWIQGISVAESPASGHPIPPHRATVTGFVGRTRRGPVDRATIVRSFGEFVRTYGGHTESSHLSRAVAHYFDNGGGLAAIVRVANRAIPATLELPAGGEVLALRARDPGRYEHVRVSVDHDQLRDDQRRFNLVIQRLSDEQPRYVVDQEIYRGVSVDPEDHAYVGDVLAGSAMLRLDGRPPRLRPDRTVGREPGALVGYVVLGSDGHDGEQLTDYDVVGSSTEGTGLFALRDVPDLSLLCIPPPPNRDLGLTTLVAAERFCRDRGAMLIVDPPSTWTSAAEARIEARGFALTSAAMLAYYPRVLEHTGRRVIGPLPACGAIAGALARKDALAGVWRGLDTPSGLLRGRLAAAEDVTPDEATALRRLGVNTLMRGSAGQCTLRGDVTFAAGTASVPEWNSLTKRRLMLFVITSIARGTSWMAFEKNDPVLWARVRLQVSNFLAHLAEQGAFAGLTPEQSWFVKCDADTLTRAPDGQPTCNLVFGVALTRPGEFLIYGISHRPGRTSARRLPVTRDLALAG
jgi:hypothetical protein